MTYKPSPRYMSAFALGVLLVALLLPMQAALAGGCCFKQITITSLGTGQQVTISGPALTTPYDLSTYGSFNDFSQRASKPSRSGPAYEVAREGLPFALFPPARPGLGRDP